MRCARTRDEMRTPPASGFSPSSYASPKEIGDVSINVESGSEWSEPSMMNRDGTVTLSGEPKPRYGAVARSSAEHGAIHLKGVKFVIDENGRRTGVFIDLVKNPGLWEDVFDQALIRRRAKEPRAALSTVRKRLVRAGKLPSGRT